MEKNTIKGATTSAPAPAVKNQPATKLETADIYAAAAALLKEHKTTSAIKAVSASQRDKYGPQNWASIWATIKELRAKAINDAVESTRADFRTFSPALESEYKRLRKCGQFGNLETYIAATYPTAAEFVAACYRDTIDGQPARKVSYVKCDKDGTASAILDAWQVLECDARRATAILDACLTSIKTAARKASNGGKDNAPVVCTRKHTAGAIVAAYDAASDETSGKIVKGKEWDGKEFAKIDGKAVSTYAPVTLAEYNNASMGGE